MFDQLLEKIPLPARAAIILCLWGGAILALGLVRLDAYGLDEGAALALLLNWSVADQVANPVITFGYPDLRALLFIPLALYWAGSMVAAKVFTLILGFIGIAILYVWRQRSAMAHGEEAALLATGLLLIAPVTILLADQIAIGLFLLLMFGLGWIVDGKYRASPHTISSLYFVQTLLVAITVTLHPMGLAYPLALALHWQRNPKSVAQKKPVWIGIAVAAGIMLVMRLGWIGLEAFANPLIALSRAVLGDASGDPAAISPLPGIVPALLLLLVLAYSLRRLLDDVLGTSLLLALLIGLFYADLNWALLALVVILYFGTPLLIALNSRIGQRGGLVGQRGLVLGALLVVATIFMQADRAYLGRHASDLLAPQDQLIQSLIPEATNQDQPMLAASQWPARTMIVVRADVLPLPPAAADPQTQLEMMAGITHIVFDHNDPDNTRLAMNFRDLTDALVTLERQSGGVILKVRDPVAVRKPQPAAPVSGDEPELPRQEPPQPQAATPEAAKP